jgi:protein O-GlcNAc transferase
MAKKIKKAKRSPRGPKKIRRAGLQEGPSLQAMLRQALSLHQAGRLPQAEALYRQILSAEPMHPEALNYLGMLAHQAGKSEIGVELVSRAITCKADYVDAYVNLGIIFDGRGIPDEAIAAFRQALSLKPDYAEVHSNLGNALRDQGKLEEAVASFRQALSLKPDYAEGYYNLGNALKDQGKLDEAAVVFRQALSLNPGYAEAHNNLGVILNDLGKLEEAAASFRRALSLNPGYVDAYNNLGVTLTDQGKLEKAAAIFQQAIALGPNYAEAHSNLGNVFSLQGKLEEAVASFRQALSLDPDYAGGYNNLGNALEEQGKLEEAMASYEQALSLNSDYAEAHSNLLLCLNYLPHISQQEIYQRSLQFERHAKKRPQQKFICTNGKKIERRLRIGYLSADFKDHSVASFIEPILRAHNRENVEIYCYANVQDPDRRTKQLQEASDHWYSIVGKPDIEVVERIRDDKIDILVDLGGHTGNNRLLIFAYKPCPVQVAWLGYPNTTGMTAMDYRFTDAIADPIGEADALYSEKLLRLEHGFLCFQPHEAAPDICPLPCMQEGHVTFGSFNNLTKVNHEVIKVWAQILRRQPRSRLLLKSKPLADGYTRNRYLQLFAEKGISADRLELHGWLPDKKDHIELYRRIDIGLDPFPYNGTTSTCEALWMGVPVITMRGDRHAARVGASIMHHVGLQELITHSEDEYIALAVSLARDQHRLRTLRGGLRQKMQGSQLMDKQRFVETLEKAYQRMWRKWCGEREP